MTVASEQDFRITIKHPCSCVESPRPGMCNADGCGDECTRECGWCEGDQWVWREIEDPTFVLIDGVRYSVESFVAPKTVHIGYAMDRFQATYDKNPDRRVVVLRVGEGKAEQLEQSPRTGGVSTPITAASS